MATRKDMPTVINRGSLEEAFSGNSHKEKESINEPKIKKVIKGKVIKKEKSLGTKFAEAFGAEDGKTVAGYLLYDVLIPALKETISSLVSGGIEMMLFGDGKPRSNIQRDRGRSHVSYSGYYNNERRNSQRNISQVGRTRHNFDEIILESKGEAEEVLSNLVDLTIEYNMATVADLYGLVGITANFTDNKYGWTNLSSAYVKRDRAGYLLVLPRTEQLD